MKPISLSPRCRQLTIRVAWSLFSLLYTHIASGQSGRQDLKLWYDRPATAWEEALPLGNGTTGAMVFGGIGRERLQLNNNTLWSGYPDPGNNPYGPKYLPLVRKAVEDGNYALAEKYWKKMQGPYSASYLHMANLFLDFPLDTAAVTNYTRSLDLGTAISSVSFRIKGVTYSREAFISYPDKVAVIRITTDARNLVNLHAWMNSRLRYEVSTSPEGTMVLKGKAPMYLAHRKEEPLQIVYDDREEGEGMNFQVAVKVASAGGTVTASDSSLQVANANSVTIYLADGTSFNGFDKSPDLRGKDPSAEIRQNLEAASAKGYEKLKADHISDYQKLFNRVQLNLGSDKAARKLPLDQRMIRFNEGDPDPQLQTLYYQFGRYLLISCSRPGSPAANLQGMWNDHVQPPWGSNYTMNINTEMNYWPAESTNLSECHEALLNFIGELAENGKETALINYGIAPGWCAHHNSDIWAKTSPPGGYESDPHSQARWACWPMAGAWLSTHLWEHYLYTGDKDFLVKKGWPLMKGAARFLLAWLQEGPDGYLVTNPSTSPEHAFKIDGKEYQISMASTMDMAITRELFGDCIRAAKVVGGERDFIKALEAARERLYPYHIGRLGQLQEWFRDWDDPGDKHRHVSHLFGLHPGTHILPDVTPELAAAAKQSLIHRGDESTGWSMAWKINWWARLRDGNHAYKILEDGLTYIDPKAEKETMSGGGTYPNLFDAHPPFQIDGNFGATAGMTEMLMQSHAGEIEILPALPDAWEKGSVRGLRARGGFTIDIEWDDHKVTKVHVHSLLGGNCRVASSLPLKVANVAYHDASGPNSNPLMQTPRPVDFVNNARSALQPLNQVVLHRVDFETEAGMDYVLTPR